MNALDELARHFPLTEREGEELGGLGWSSGVGWQNTPDWFHEPSYGDLIFIGDDEGFRAKWISDLEFIRHRHANERKRAAGVELYAALQNILNGIETGLVKIDTPAEEAWANAMRAARAATAKARGAA